MRYGTRCQGTQLSVQPTRLSTSGMHRVLAFAFPAEAGPYLSTPEGWKAELA